MNVNHFKLVQVEMFDGYEMSKEGEIMINKPKFKLLKKGDIDSLTTTTLCRLKRYYNNNLKIKRDLLSFPIEGQYFFIQPENSITQTVDQTIKKGKQKIYQFSIMFLKTMMRLVQLLILLSRPEPLLLLLKQQ